MLFRSEAAKTRLNGIRKDHEANYTSMSDQDWNFVLGEASNSPKWLENRESFVARKVVKSGGEAVNTETTTAQV